jgi:hypothetical protein
MRPYIAGIGDAHSVIRAPPQPLKMRETGFCPHPKKNKTRASACSKRWTTKAAFAEERSQSRDVGGDNQSFRGTTEAALFNYEQDRYRGSVFAVALESSGSLCDSKRIRKSTVSELLRP